MLDISFNIPYNDFVARDSNSKSRTLLPATINFKDYQKEIEMCNTKELNITGKKYNYLTAIRFDHYNKRKDPYWLFKCACGNEKVLRKSKVVNNETKSCGCLARAFADKLIRHNKSRTKLYKIHIGMKQRCYNKKAANYHNYGGRGITMCDAWKTDFMSFYTWAIENGYKEGLTIDRIDNNGNYCPENCRWATDLEQHRNTRNNRLITYNNETHCLAEWAELFGIRSNTLRQRLRWGWPIEEALGIVERK